MAKSTLMLILFIILSVFGYSGRDAAPTPQPTEAVSAAEDAVENDSQLSSVDDYMSSVKQQSDAIKAYLEHDAKTQADMNAKSEELFELWDGALNRIWSELKAVLPKDEFEKLQTEQNTWIAQKNAAVEEAGKDFKYGSMYALIVNSEAAALTEQRVCELYDLLLASK